MERKNVYFKCQAHIHEYCEFSYRVVLFGMHAYLHFALRTSFFFLFGGYSSLHFTSVHYLKKIRDMHYSRAELITLCIQNR